MLKNIFYIYLNKIYGKQGYMHRGCIISYFSRHITLQPWLPTEAKKGWAWSVPGWETSWVKLGCCWKRCLWDQQGVLTLQSVWVLMPQYSDGDTILSFGWDVKLRTWLSVVIKNPRKSFEKSRGNLASWPNFSIGPWPSWPLNHP